MKPEEFDQLFREKLEELEAVPGMDWTPNNAWEKITTKLYKGWNPLGTLLILIGIIGLILYVLLPSRNTPKVLKPYSIKKNTTVLDTVILKPTITPNQAKKHHILVNKNKRITSAVPVKVTEMVTDINQSLSPDTLNKKTGSNTIEKKASSIFLFRRFQLMNTNFTKQPREFSLPKSHFLQMKVSNELNFKNLIQSLKAQQNGGENLYYNYEYNNNLRFPFEIINPKNPSINTIHITNINHQK